MIYEAVDRMLVFGLGCALAFYVLGQMDPPQQLPLVKSDFTQCRVIDPGPIVSQKKFVNYGDRRPDNA
jgi:hypothetical protein